MPSPAFPAKWPRPTRKRGLFAAVSIKILGETAGVDRFRSKDAYARHKGTAPMPVWSSNRARHRLSRTGNRQINAALHRSR
nr:IS110 family transposase [Rhodococcus qingshengii]